MARISAVDELRLLSKVSKLYYEEGLNQDDIVRKLQLSTAKVSRLLKEARERGIVRITVIPPPGIYADIEVALESRYHLQEVVVVEVSDPSNKESITRELGSAAAVYLQRVVKNGDVIGVSWGSTLNYMVNAVSPADLPEAQVVQIIGGLGPAESEVHATDLCRRLARMLNCRLMLLPVPGIVTSAEVKETILKEASVQRSLQSFSGIDVAFVGIGSPTPDSVMMRDSAIISQKELEQLLRLGAVGDIALRFFDATGTPIVSEIDRRVIGITLAELARIPRITGVAGGMDKVNVIHAALCGKWINALITDHLTAQELLKF